MACPNKAHPGYKVLEKEYGSGKALALWEENGEQIPTVEQVKVLLEPLPFEVAAQRVYTGFQNKLYPVVEDGIFKGFLPQGIGKDTLIHAIKDWISGISKFSSVRIVDEEGLIKIMSALRPDKQSYYQLSSNAAPADEKLNKLLTDYTQNVLGGKVNVAQQIVVEGKLVSANAVTDVINKTIELAEGKVKIDTLPEEVSHIYVHWLPKNSLLLRDMLKDIKSRPVYDQVMAEYKDNKHYQNADGTVNEHKIAIEAIGKMIAGTIVKQYQDKRAKSLLQRLIEWIRSIFKGKQDFYGYKTASSEILTGDNSRFNKESTKLINTKNFKYELQSIFRGQGNREQGDVIQTTLDYYRRTKKTSEEIRYGGFWKGQDLSDYIKQEGLEYTGTLDEKDIFDKGAESIVYNNKINHSVIKVNEGLIHKLDDRTWITFLHNILLHNKFFPDTAYKLLGFKKIEDEWKAILEQPVVITEESYDKKVLDDFLNVLGFVPYTKEEWIHKVDYNYYNKDLDIYLNDLHNKNVLFKEGKPFFIDTMFKLGDDFFKIKSAEDANNKGEYYFQLDPQEEKDIRKQLKENGANKLQLQVAEDVYFEPHTRVILDKDTHTYSDLNIANPTIYTSVTTAIGGDKKIVGYDDNREWGNDFDRVLSDIIQQKDVIRDTPYIDDKTREQLITYLQGVVNGLTADGSIALTQVIVADKESKIAGSIDLMLITPAGDIKIIDLKTSWNSRKDSSNNIKNDRGEGAILQGKLSKAQEHSIQLGAYAKLVELLGYTVSDRRIYHLMVNSKNGKVVGFTDEGMVQHPSSENETLVNKVVPTIYQGKDRLAELRGEPQPERQQPVDPVQQQINDKELEERFGQIAYSFTTWRDYLAQLKHHVGYIPEDNTIKKIDDLLHAMELELNEKHAGAYSSIYTKFLVAAQSHLTSLMKYLTDNSNKGKSDYIHGVFLAKKYLETFSGLYRTENFTDGHPEQKLLYEGVEKTARSVSAVIVQSIQDYVKGNVADWSTNPLYTDKTPVTLDDGTVTTKGEQALQKAVTRNKDISEVTRLGDTIGNSGIPVLENMSKQFADARATRDENTHHIKNTIRVAAKALVQAMGIRVGNSADSRRVYDWMFQRDTKGNKNGQIISQIGTHYKQMQQKVNDPLWHIVDGRVEKKEYIKGDNLTDDQKAWNISLWKLRKDRSDFLAPEIVSGDRKTRTVSSTDGAYHELTPEFRKEREHFMKQSAFRNGEWLPKNANSPEFIAWLHKNYDWVQYTGPVMIQNKVTKEWEPTGQVETKQKYFIKKENSRARKETNDGQLLWDKEYHRIMTGGTATDKAQKAYYEAYVATIRTQVEKLPAGAMNWFEQGFIPMIGANWVQMLSSKDVTMASVITDQLRNFFEITAYTNQSDRQRLSAPAQSVPIMYMSNLQSSKRVQEIKDMIADHDKKKVGKSGQALKDWGQKRNDMIDLLKRESSKMTAEQLHPDLTTGLEAFIDMSENFHVMTAIEDKVLAVKEQLKAMEFEKKNGRVVPGIESKAYQLYSHVLDTIYYGEMAAHSFTEQAISKIMKVTSAISIPLNIFGMLNNKFVARVNNRLDAIGSNFFSHKAYNEALKDYNLRHLPGYISTRVQHMGDDMYTDKKNGSLYEALTNDFHMVRHLKSAEGRVDFLSRIGGYAGYEAGEWEVQSLVGNAILRSVQMKYTGNDPNLHDCSVYDAHRFDPNTGKQQLIEGYKYTNKDGAIADDQKKAKHLIINRIHETNDRIHGNYDPANKIMLERNFAGKLILQFHKWVYPNFKQRFQAGKFDENLGGGMDIEGRYQTLWGLIKAYKNLGISADRWNELTDHQKANLKKDFADAVYIAGLFAFATILRAATDGIPDDDPYVKRMRNWLLYQSDRGLQEVSIFVPIVGELEAYQLVQNPFAATTTVRNFAVILKDMAEYPFQDEAHRYIQRGNFKGESHLYNSLQKVIPLEKELRQWENLSTISSFYLGNSK